MKTYNCVGLPGGLIHRNPVISTAVGRKAETDIPIGAFCWDSKPGFVTNTGEGKPLGIVMRDSRYIGKNHVPRGANVSIAIRGDILTMTDEDAELGQRVFASLEDGSITPGNSGDVLDGYVETEYVFERSVDGGDVALISNWNTR